MDGQKLRQASKMLTTREAAKALGLPRWKVDRQVALGAIAYNKLGSGELCCHETDLWALTDVDDCPRVLHGWFDCRTLLDIRQFGKYCESEGRQPLSFFASRSATTGLTTGESILRHECYQFAAYHLRNGSPRYGFDRGSQHVENLYQIGPDKWRLFAGDCRTKLLGLTFAMRGKRTAFRSACRAGFPEFCKRAVQEAF